MRLLAGAESLADNADKTAQVVCCLNKGENRPAQKDFVGEVQLLSSGVYCHFSLPKKPEIATLAQAELPEPAAPRADADQAGHPMTP